MTIATKLRRSTLVRIAWIDARHPMANQELWGLTLLERNLKQLARLGIEQAVVLVAAGNAPRKHFFHPLPKTLETTFIKTEPNRPFVSLKNQLEANGHPVLVLEGNAIYDSRVLEKLLQSEASVAATSDNGVSSAGAAVLFNGEANLFDGNGTYKISSALQRAIQASQIASLDLRRIESYRSDLRSNIEPYLLLVENEEQLRAASKLLKKSVHKGVNDFVAKYIHPPLEFAGTRLLSRTRVKPDMVTLVGIVLSIVATYLFAGGQLLAGAILAAVKGVLDGIDGKLARLTLRFSKYGERLDHVGDTVFDGLWYLALGWHFSGGGNDFTAMKFTTVLFGSYVVARLVPGIFKKRQGVEIYDYTRIDRTMRLIGSRMNNNIWLFLIGIILGVPQQTFYAISIWMLLTATWLTGRLVYVTLRRRKQTSA